MSYASALACEQVALDDHPILKKVCMRFAQFCTCTAGDTCSDLDMADFEEFFGDDKPARGHVCAHHRGVHVGDFMLDLSSILFEFIPSSVIELIESSIVNGVKGAAAPGSSRFKDPDSLLRASQLRFKLMQRLMPSLLRGLPASR